MNNENDAPRVSASAGTHSDRMDSYIEEAHRKAQHFIDHETQFHLGVLPTEQSNPKTAGLAETAQRDLEAAIGMLQAVDADVLPKATQVFAGAEFQRLVDALRRALDGQGRICFSGCGATGRLSILLEVSWRQFWQDLQVRHPAIAAKLPPLEHRVVSIMTGGDYALIRSVENFEDHQVFGRRQVQEAGLGNGDVLVAISEGGETSSVIGTIWQALDNGADVFFAFNNPAALLAQHIERSRQVIEDSRVTILDLSCGPMGVAGSTRMQATTSELLVVGAALEIALTEMLREKLDAADLARLAIVDAAPADYSRWFAGLLQGLGQPEAVAALAAMVRYEEQLYRSHGLVTYLADQCLLDIFTDTTERSPTFMLPRFRSCDDQVSPPSWAFVKNPRLPTPQAWRAGSAPRSALSHVGCRNVPPVGRPSQPAGESAAVGERGHVQVPDRQRERRLPVQRREPTRPSSSRWARRHRDWPCRKIRCVGRSTPVPGRLNSGLSWRLVLRRRLGI